MPTLLALDPGERRTGIAISDATATLARPLTTHDRQRDGSLLQMVADLCREHDVQLVIVGHAVRQSGAEGDSAARSRRVADLLRSDLDAEVKLFDERYTTVEADRILAGRNRPREKRDAVAAAVLLQTYLDQQPRDPS